MKEQKSPIGWPLLQALCEKGLNFDKFIGVANSNTRRGLDKANSLIRLIQGLKKGQAMKTPRQKFPTAKQNERGISRN